MKLKILNIPNYYCSYYLQVLDLGFDLRFIKKSLFRNYDFKPYLIFEIRNEVFIIDNNDPVGIERFLLDKCKYYFSTNKLKNKEYAIEKIIPLFPHYPINVNNIYVKLFASLPFLFNKRFIYNLYVNNLRPYYKNYIPTDNDEEYVFFSSSLWEKEKSVNELRAKYIRLLKKREDVIFEGGFTRRKDNRNFGFKDIIIDKRYSPKSFSLKSQKSLFVFNNSAVLGAVSWRLAEYLNYGSVILSDDFRVELPVPLSENEVIFINNSKDLKKNIGKLLDDKTLRKKLSCNSKKYFEDYCSPRSQLKYIEKYL